MNAKFATVGARTITLSGEDSRGVKGKSQKLAVLVEPASSASHSIITILTPSSGASLPTNSKSHFSASITSAAPITSYLWTASMDNRDPITLGTTSTVDWEPTGNFHVCGTAKLTITLKITTADGHWATQWIPVNLEWGPC